MLQSAYCVVQTTCPDQPTCQTIIKELFDLHLAACVQVQEIQSHYIWEGKIQHEKELLLNIKTLSKHFQTIQNLICKLHPYEVPEIIQIPILKGSPPYLQWINKATYA